MVPKTKLLCVWGFFGVLPNLLGVVGGQKLSKNVQKCGGESLCCGFLLVLFGCFFCSKTRKGFLVYSPQFAHAAFDGKNGAILC